MAVVQEDHRSEIHEEALEAVPVEAQVDVQAATLAEDQEVNPAVDLEEVFTEVEASAENQEKCIRQYVLSAKKNAKFHLSQLKENQSIAGIASEAKRAINLFCFSLSSRFQTR